MTNFDFAVAIQKIATKRDLQVDDDALLAVQQNNRVCLCNIQKTCPCSDITDNGCPCGLFLPKE